MREFFVVKDLKFINIVIALAGIFQSALLVKKYAETGQTDEKSFNASINSIYKIDAPDVPSVYGDIEGVLLGLQELKVWCDKTMAYNNLDVNRYIHSLMYLERKIASDKTKSETLTRRIKQAVLQANYFSATHPTVISSLASIYVDIFGSYSFRIQVLGSAEILSKSDIANKVRALLLAGIRSAVLWRQVGGGRLQLIFMRHKIMDTVQLLLSSIQSNKAVDNNNAIS